MAVERTAVDFFRRVGDIAAEANVFFCLEPNPISYNCNFMTTTAEAAAMVELVSHPFVRLQIDIGAMTLNGEPIEETINRFAPLAGHVHASEPKLAILHDEATHATAAAALAGARPDLAVTIEMTTPRNEPPVAAVANALTLVQRTYGAMGNAQ
jgi:sugar phosphate isomerase/epimerase